MMSDEEIKQAIGQSMDDLTASFNAETQQKLNQIRMNAVQQKPRRKLSMWSFAGAFAAITLVVILMINKQQNFNAPESNLTLFADLELLASDEGTDFYQDLEFLDWLDTNGLLETKT